MLIELAVFVIAMDVYTESTPGAPQPRFDLPAVYYCCSGMDFIYTETRPHVTAAVFTHWTHEPYVGQAEFLAFAISPFILPAQTLDNLAPGRHILDVRAYNAQGDWVGWLADEIVITCGGDVTLDQSVSSADLLAILEQWGNAGGDLNQDGTTDVFDLIMVLGNWGSCAEP